MSVKRKILHSAFTCCLVFLVIEGTARVMWWRLEHNVFLERKARGEAILGNPAVNFVRSAHGVYGYALKPNSRAGTIHINPQGSRQRDTVPLERRARYLRVAWLGESTTFGGGVDNNYPACLRKILQSYGRGFDGYEVINAGVPGWVSDQIALQVEHEIAAYRPDAVIL